jgi:hypothetical protein
VRLVFFEESLMTLSPLMQQRFGLPQIHQDLTASWQYRKQPQVPLLEFQVELELSL